MITDAIDQLKRYAVPKAEAILKFINNHDCANLPDGEIEIEGRELFVRVMSNTPKPAEQNRFEKHIAFMQMSSMWLQVLRSCKLPEKKT